MNSIAADFLTNLLASESYRIWGKESGVVTDEHVDIFADEGISVMGESAQEEEERAGGGQGEQGTDDGVTRGQGGQEGGVLEDEGGGGDLAGGQSGARSPVREEREENAVQPQGGLESDPNVSRSGTELPIRQETETPATGDGASDNPEPTTPERAQSSSTPPINTSDPQAESSTQGDSAPTGQASEQLPINPSDPQAESSAQADSAAPAEEAGEKPPTALPEDDGMRALRERVLHIQVKDIPTDEKARLMHELLTEGYTKSQVGQEKLSTVPPSPATVVSQERPTTPTSISSFNFWPGKDNFNSPEKGDTVTFRLTQDDLKPTYAPLPPPVEGASDGSDDVEQTQVFGCQHYKRNVKLQCFTCNKWYTCRLCHDAAETHTLPRRETKNMLCMICGNAQRAAEICTHCTGRAANYYCDICHLWEDDPNRSIYHCNDCGICRVGMGLGKDFFHCKTCGLCMNISMEMSHKCIERSSDCDCPICHEYMFTSPQTVVFMKCGHTIHKHCYHAHLDNSYKCPICQQTIVNMETHFRAIDRAIEAQPMPEQFQDTKAMITCNDCRAKSAVPYHWLGLKCAVCDSYNTIQLNIINDEPLAPPEEAGGQGDSAAEGATAEMAIPVPRSRRHSLSAEQTLAPRDYSSGLAPDVPSRFGRSMSPVRGSYFAQRESASPVADDAEVWDDEDTDFWGRTPEDLAMGGDEEEEEEEEDDEDDEELSLEDDDDDDDIDTMELFGHR
ncbi:hypothetical protein VE00_04832 [Pseudogymnoascus sp. WSF 3629]|nr:hypothetical protein VE00_04832 [Pseudogymnoascus sp. WSF 3629]